MAVETAAGSLAAVARRWWSLDDEARELSRHVKAILDDVAADLVAVYGVGYETAGQLLVIAATTPIASATSSPSPPCAGPPRSRTRPGRTNRHRLNRGGDRHANSALWTIVLVRMGSHPPTQAYVERRTAEGLSKPEIMRCLKRSVARELFPLIQATTGPSVLEEGGTESTEVAA